MWPNDEEKPVVIVTGGAQGIGRRLVEKSVENGWRVAVLDIQAAPMGVLDSKSVMYLEVDITKDENVQSALASVYSSFRRIDALVNAAALFTALKHEAFTEISTDTWTRVFAVNVLGPFLLSKYTTPYLRTAGGGAIVNFSSNVVAFGMANFMHYVSSKAAIIGMTRSLARELGPDRIRVNAVSPGFVTTEITEKEREPEYRAALVNRQCIPDPMSPDDICSTVLFLVSPGARAITGQNIVVNSGSHMGGA